MMKKTSVLLISGLLIFGFQNCAPVNFAEKAEKAIAANTDDLETVCDPFSENSDCATNPEQGLIGSVYYLTSNVVGVQNYIDYGTKLKINLQLTNLDIPTRQFSSGFPTSQGVIQDAQGQPLIEFFALDLKGYLQLDQNYMEGGYQFAIASDDGAILDVDGQTLVDNDGWHSRIWKCSDASIYLKRGEKHSMRLRYYQGPRVEIALQVYMRPLSQQGNSCDDNGGWTIIPASLLNH
jgi:hypothetical protein